MEDKRTEWTKTSVFGDELRELDASLHQSVIKMLLPKGKITEDQRLMRQGINFGSVFLMRISIYYI